MFRVENFGGMNFAGALKKSGLNLNGKNVIQGRRMVYNRYECHGFVRDGGGIVVCLTYGDEAHSDEIPQWGYVTDD